MNNIPENHLEAIRRKFLIKLQENIEPFQKFLSEISSKNIKSSHCKEIKTTIHQIAGSGKTFGFDNVSEHASMVEEQIDNIIENNNDNTMLDLLESEMKSLIEVANNLVKELDVEVKDAPSENKPDTEFEHQILIVDDDNLVIELIANYLMPMKVKVLSTSDEKEAFKIINDSSPDLIILDVNLPKVKGFEVLGNLKDNTKTKDIPVIMLTKQDNDNSIIEGITKGAIEYITKPFDIDKFAEKIITFLE